MLRGLAYCQRSASGVRQDRDLAELGVLRLDDDVPTVCLRVLGGVDNVLDPEIRRPSGPRRIQLGGSLLPGEPHPGVGAPVTHGSDDRVGTLPVTHGVPPRHLRVIRRDVIDAHPVGENGRELMPHGRAWLPASDEWFRRRMDEP